METETIQHHTDQKGIMTITLNRPEKHNAFDQHIIETLTHLLQTANTNPQVRVVILKANGKNFSAGADLHWMRQMIQFSHEQNLEDAMQLATLMQTFNTLEKPTIAIAHGAVFGGGVGLIACCDIAFASEDTVFCFSEVKLGLVPAVISPYVVAAIGQRAARRYCLTAEPLDAPTAHRLGLVHDVMPEHHLHTAVVTICEQLKKNGPNALCATKALIQRVTDRPIDEAILTVTAESIANARISSEGQDGVSAFLEKRAPKWITA